MSEPKIIETRSSKRSVEETTKEIMEELTKVFDAMKNAEKEITGIKREMDQNSAQAATLTEEATKAKATFQDHKSNALGVLRPEAAARTKSAKSDQALKTRSFGE